MERKVPSALWIGIAALGAMTVIKLLVGLQKGSDRMFIDAILCAVLGAGLLVGYKWAYVLTLVFGLGNPIVIFGRNPKQP
jgi:divalent metal cation (Fe/Co/Zn/Cd) transporter